MNHPIIIVSNHNGMEGLISLRKRLNDFKGTTVILLPSAESFKKGCCQLQAEVCAQSTG